MERTVGENKTFLQTIKSQKFSNINGLRNLAIRKAISFRVRPVMTASIRLLNEFGFTETTKDIVTNLLYFDKEKMKDSLWILENSRSE